MLDSGSSSSRRYSTNSSNVRARAANCRAPPVGEENAKIMRRRSSGNSSIVTQNSKLEQNDPNLKPLVPREVSSLQSETFGGESRTVWWQNGTPNSASREVSGPKQI